MHRKNLIFAIVLIAAYALNTPANAQFDALKPAGNTAGSVGGSSSAKNIAITPNVRAELVAYAPDGAAPGATVLVGLQITHQPEWHTYWKNSGDSGLPTTLQWTLPTGVSAGEIRWPLPKKIPIGTLANYGYEGTVLLAVPLAISAQFKPGLLSSSLPIELKAAWLVCRQECIPEEALLRLDLPVQGSTALHQAAFETARLALPVDLPAAGQQVLVAADGKSISVKVAGLPEAWRGQKLALFPETGGVTEPAAPYTQAWQGALWTANVPLSAQRSESPARMPLVLGWNGSGYRAVALVQSAGGDSGGAAAGAAAAGEPVRTGAAAWPALPEVAAVPPGLAAALSANAAAQAAPVQADGSASPGDGAALGLLPALLLALLGGLILNLMPCVFPVLAIKVLGFAKHANNRRVQALNGAAYSVGVVLSFVALGGLMLALRAGGDALGWGFQLQSPWVVASLAALFTLIGLNLAGLFELGSVLPSSVASVQVKNPQIDAFLSGVLAVAIASPCTAPFMGASLGAALTLPAGQALAVFAAIGVGMAAPYVLASLVPAVARALPRPGAWMDVFKRFMAFPMFATVAWLVWVLGQQTGMDGAGALLMLLLLLAMLAWALGLAGRSRTVVAIISIALLILSVPALGPFVVNTSDGGGPLSATADNGLNTNASGGLNASAAQNAIPGSSPTSWQPWQPGKVEQLLASGQPVFVDFTAAWCVTCQVNKKTTLSNTDVLQDFAAKKVQMLRADWTRRDPAITVALQQLGRSGVPVYVLYKPGSAPVVMSEILSVGIMRKALAAL